LEFSGTELIRSPVRKVFAFVSDPENFTTGIPDIESVQIKSADEFTVVAKLGLPLLRGIFTIDFLVKEKKEFSHARLVGHGTGMGSAIDLDIVVDLGEGRDGETQMRWRAEAKVAGRLASLGQRLLGSAAEKLVKEAFESIRKNLEASS
jgi:carbon monoxide dehydrogenase subunit G